MKKLLGLLLGAVLVGVGCVNAAQLQGYELMITKKIDQDTQFTTTSGAIFMVQKNWFVTERDELIILEEPDRELTVTLVENSEETVQKAVQSAWKKVQPNFARIIEDETSGLAQDGWQEYVQIGYETQLQESRVVAAIARRVEKTWYIELIDGTKAAFERQSAGFFLVMTSFKVPGMHEESFVGKKADLFDDQKLQELNAFIEEARVQCNIPGLAFGIVQNNKLVFEKGLGVQSLSGSEKITPETLFMIGSATKPLTTFMMASLIDEGKFTWDTSVTEVMPDFALGDAAITKQVLMKHMVSANTGMPRQDIGFLFNTHNVTPEMRIKEMKSMVPTTGFGQTFQYSNFMVMAGGYIAASTVDKKHEIGKAYDQAMQTYVFDPIGMKSTTFDFEKAENVNHAIPHGFNLQGTYVPLSISTEEQCLVSVRPAGGAWSNVHDMAQYMITELNNGITADGKRIISEENLLKRREPQIKITDTMSYGLALMMNNDHGVLTVGHGGNTNGFTTNMFFLPEHNIGFVILINAAGANMFAQAVQRKFMELLFDGKIEADKMLSVGLEQQKKMCAKNLETIILNPDSTWLNSYSGIYEHPTLGQMTLKEVAQGVELSTSTWKSSLGQRKQNDGTLQLITVDVPFAGLEFLPEQHGNIMQLVLELGQHTYVFERIKR